MMGLISKMMAHNMSSDRSMMPQMMTKMMPNCLKTMLPAIPKDERIDFVMDMVSVLIDQGSSEMSEDEKRRSWQQ